MHQRHCLLLHPGSAIDIVFCILFADRRCVFSEAHHKNNFFTSTRMPMTRCTQTLWLPRGAQIKIEYNPRRPSIRTIVHQVETLGYTVLVRPFQGRWEENSQGFTSQRVGAHLLLLYPPPFDHQRNEEEIAREQNDQVYIKSVEVEITDDLFENSVVPSLEIEDEDSRIEYKGVIINWLQREYGEHREVVYTLFEEYLLARNKGWHCYPSHRARFSD